jgi:hypothetical protein
MPLVHNPSAQTIRITLMVAGASALALLVGLVLRARGSAWSDLLLLAAALLLLLCAIVLPLAWATGRRMQRQLQEMMDAAWAHWTYSDAERRIFSDAEYARDLKRARRLPLQIVGTALIAGAALHFMQDRWTFWQGLLLLGGVIGVPLALVVGLSTWLTARSTHRQRLVTAGDVYIGPNGVYQDGSYSTWKAFGLALKGVHVEKGDPSVLQFRITVRQSEDWLLRVAIPSGKEKEAAALAARFGHP